MLKAIVPSCLLLALGGCIGDRDSTATDDTTTIEDAVINGTSPANGWPRGQGRLVRFNTGTGSCSGTLVRNRRVLTAKHCLHPQGWVDQSSGFSPWTSMSVVPEGGGTAVGLTGYTWFGGTEVAVLYLASDLQLATEANGRYGQYTSVWHGSDNTMLTNTGNCWGYGINAATQAQCNANLGGSGAGTLRFHFNIATLVNSARVGYFGNNSNQNWSAGDSGGSCYLIVPGSAALKPNAIGPLGWYGDPTCKSYNGQWHATRLDTPHPASYRDVYRSVIASASDATTDTFSTNTLFAYAEEHEAGVNPNWSWSAAGELVQPNNAFVWNGSIIDGSNRILNQRPMGDGFVAAIIYSSDNDVGGVIGRWQNEDSFYRVGFDEERRIGQLLKRTGNTYQVLATYTLPASFNWSTPHTVGIGMRGTTIWGYLDGSWVMSAVDSMGDVMDGYSGIVSAGLSDTHVDQFWTVNWP
jgi:hypothetical protein